MSVFITGVGGVSTADATANPNDVLNGKIFYNANGRQTGIWTPSIKDFEKSFSITIEYGSSSSSGKNNMVMEYNTDYKMTDVQECTSRWHNKRLYFNESGININAFTGITFDGEFRSVTLPIPVSMRSPDIYAQFNNGNGYGRFTIGINYLSAWAFYGGITLSSDDAQGYQGKMVTIHYI